MSKYQKRMAHKPSFTTGLSRDIDMDHVVNLDFSSLLLLIEVPPSNQSTLAVSISPLLGVLRWQGITNIHNKKYTNSGFGIPDATQSRVISSSLLKIFDEIGDWMMDGGNRTRGSRIKKNIQRTGALIIIYSFLQILCVRQMKTIIQLLLISSSPFIYLCVCVSVSIASSLST